MRRDLRLIIPGCLFVLLLVSGCEISRPAGSLPDLPTIQPSQTTIQSTEPITAQAAEVSPPPADIESAVAPAPTAPPVEAIEPGRLLIKLKPEAAIKALENEMQGQDTSGTPKLDSLLTKLGATNIEPIIVEVAKAAQGDTEIMSTEAEQTGQIYAITLPPNSDAVAVAQTISADPSVEYAEPNFSIGMASQPETMPNALEPNDPYFQYQWNLKAIGVPQAWDSSTGQNVIVAIIDTGVDFKAPDLANTQHLPGYDFVNNDADPTDDQGHGTHVAGTIAQTTNNGLGVAGVAFNAQILPVKVLDAKGQGNYENIIKGIVYAVDQGARVINMSLAGRNGSQALEEAVKYAHDHGVVVVAAVGNSNSAVEYPAAYDDFVIGVGAVTLSNTKAPYSDFGPQVDIMAPGGSTKDDVNKDGFGDGILQQTISTSGSGYSYRFFEGTSMASPHIAGVAALMLSVNPNASPDQIEAAMTQTAQNLGPLDQFGAGLVQAASAIQAMGGVTPVTVTVETPTTEAATALPINPTDTPVAETPIAENPTATPEPPTPIVENPTETPTIAPPPPDVPTETPTPLVMATPTPVPPPPPAGSNLLANGDFEDTTSWVFGDTPIQAAYDNMIVQGGGQAIRLGNPDGPDWHSYTSIWQAVTLPAEANQVVLNANIYPMSADCCGDYQQILVLNQQFGVIKTLMRSLKNTQEWETVSYDLSDLKGQTVYIYMGVFNMGGSGRTTSMYVDNVSLTWQ